DHRRHGFLADAARRRESAGAVSRRDEDPRRSTDGAFAMTNAELNDAWRVITTANIADACIRLGASFSIAPTIVRPLFAGARCAGRALPVRHFGSLDVFLDTHDGAEAGHLLVIDNDNRQDEGCIGDLTVIEDATAGTAGGGGWGWRRARE